MKIAIVGHLKHPIRKPYSGGLEMFTHALVDRLRRRGHDVTLFASGDSDADLPIEPIVDRATVPDSMQRFGFEDHAYIEAVEDEAYESLMLRLTRRDFDVIHNNSISPIPLQFASMLPVEMVTTLHVPVLPRLRNMIAQRSAYTCGRFVNISHSNAAVWRRLIPNQTVIHNGVDTDFWKGCADKAPSQCDEDTACGDAYAPKPRAVWWGRILPDKGTHFAIEAAHRAGLAIDVIGPVANDEYFQNHVETKFREGDVYHGHQSHEDICRLVGNASVAMITPNWDEPFGLVVAEAMACGTPIAAFDRGAIAELVTPEVGRVVPGGNVNALAFAAGECLSLSPSDCRRRARRNFSLDTMLDRYESLFHGQAADTKSGTTVGAALRAA